MQHQSTQDGKISTTIILIFTTAAVLRIAALGKYVFMDESPILFNLVNFYYNHTLMPIHFNYPTCFSYLAAIPTAIGALILYIGGTLTTPTDMMALFDLDHVLGIIPARLTSVVFGLATILRLFKVGA